MFFDFGFLKVFYFCDGLQFFYFFFGGVVITVWCRVEEECYDVTCGCCRRSDGRERGLGAMVEMGLTGY